MFSKPKHDSNSLCTDRTWVMTPEEKDRIVAETKKLKTETLVLKKGGWGKPASWIPIVAATAAIATSVGQWQYSSIKEREASLDAREKVIEAKEEESRLIERNAKLEEKSEELSKEIQNSTSEILQLKGQIDKANAQLLAIAKAEDKDGSLVAKVEKELKERNEQVATIVASAESRNLEVQIRNLVWQMNSNIKSARMAAVAELIEDYNSNRLAISSSLDLLKMPQLETLSPSGRINVLVFLRNTEQSSWNDDLKNRASSAIRLIRKRASENKAYIGPQTEDALRKLNKFLSEIA